MEEREKASHAFSDTVEAAVHEAMQQGLTILEVVGQLEMMKTVLVADCINSSKQGA